MAWPLRSSGTFTAAPLRASCLVVSPSGTATTPPFDRKALQKVMLTAQHITGSELLAIQDNTCQAVIEKGPKKFPRLQPPETWTVLHAPIWQAVPVHHGSDNRLLNSFYPLAVRLLNCLQLLLSLSNRLSPLSLGPSTYLYPLRQPTPLLKLLLIICVTPLHCCPLIIDCHYL